jgi:hypothetical protein
VEAVEQSLRNAQAQQQLAKGTTGQLRCGVVTPCGPIGGGGARCGAKGGQWWVAPERPLRESQEAQQLAADTTSTGGRRGIIPLGRIGACSARAQHERWGVVVAPNGSRGPQAT